MASNIEFSFSIKDIQEKFSQENLNIMRNEILRYRAYDLERITSTEICICKNSIPCNKNAIYFDKKNGNKPLCWYHALLLTKGTDN